MSLVGHVASTVVVFYADLLMRGYLDSSGLNGALTVANSASDAGNSNTSGYSDEYRNYREQSDGFVKDYLEDVSMPGWKETRKRHGITIKELYFTKYKRSVFMGEVFVKHPIQDVCMILWDRAHEVPEWYYDTEFVRMIKEWDDMRISYQASKRVGLVQARDYVMPDRGLVYLVFASTTYKDLPELDDVVRAESGPAGYQLVTTTQEDVNGNKVDGTMIRWILNMNMKLPAIVPQSILNRLLPISMVEFLKKLNERLDSTYQTSNNDVNSA
ncbi:unnamed protein product [Notodromas monacha]|uniref:START domain-containing protein n=1 Tax=Notodromas monacha TaxID=399045 RepID=A0A7R9GIA5_9CRUS|nr:unnamed protein product [Notodromas monacha]CAG0923756.1 unnamed protein product [Notodromas monacha]